MIFYISRHMNITVQSPHKFGEAKEGIVSRRQRISLPAARRVDTLRWFGLWWYYMFLGPEVTSGLGGLQLHDPSQILVRSFVALSLWMRKARRLDRKLKFFGNAVLECNCLVFSCWMWIRKADESHYPTMKNVQEKSRNNNGNFWKWSYQGSQNFSFTYVFVLALKQNHISWRHPADNSWYQ